MIATSEKRCVLKVYVIVLRPIFNTTYYEKNKSKYTCEPYITNSSYSKKVGIVFAMYQRIRSKGTSWDGPRLYGGILYKLHTKRIPYFILLITESKELDKNVKSLNIILKDDPLNIKSNTYCVQFTFFNHGIP